MKQEALTRGMIIVLSTALVWAITVTVRISMQVYNEVEVTLRAEKTEAAALKNSLREGLTRLSVAVSLPQNESAAVAATAHACRPSITLQAFQATLRPNCQKAYAVQRLWDGMLQDVTEGAEAAKKVTGGVVYWHVEQTGGGSMCRIALAENLYAERFWERIPESKREAAIVQLARTDCRSGYIDEVMCGAGGLSAGSCSAAVAAGGSGGGLGGDSGGGFGGRNVKYGYGEASFDTRTWEAQAAAGRRFFAMKPADCWDDRDEPCWHCCARTLYPSAWYAKPWFKDPADPFWTRWAHIVTVRDPGERFYSDYHARHFRQWWCEIIGVWEGACIDDMLTPAGRASLQQKWDDIGHNGTALLGVVENRLVSNALVMHLSGTPDNLALAKRNLRRMTLVLDFKARREESYFLLRNLFYWSDERIDSHVARFHDDFHTFKTIREGKQYEALKAGPLALDYELWEDALELVDSHAAALGFKPPPLLPPPPPPPDLPEAGASV